MKVKITTPRFKRQRVWDFYGRDHRALVFEVAERVAQRDGYPAGSNYTFASHTSGRIFDPEARFGDEVVDGAKLHLVIR